VADAHAKALPVLQPEISVHGKPGSFAMTERPAVAQSPFEVWFGTAVDIWRAANPEVTVREIIAALDTLRHKLTEETSRH
jgi:hypothetical protein